MQQFPLAAGLETGQADDLAGIQADLAGCPARDKAPQANHRPTGRNGFPFASCSQIRVTAHERDEPFDRGVARAPFPDVAAVAHDDDAGRHVHDLVQLVADEDESEAFGGLPADIGAQLLRTVERQRRGGLVQDDDFSPGGGERAGDLHHLPRSDREARDLRVDIDGGVGKDSLDGRPGPVPKGLAPAGQAAGAFRSLQVEVLRNGQIGAEREFLVDDADAVALGVGGAVAFAPRRRAAGEGYAAAVGWRLAAQHAHERALSGSVAAHQPDDLAAGDRQVDPVAGAGRTVGLRQLAQRNERLDRLRRRLGEVTGHKSYRHTEPSRYGAGRPGSRPAIATRAGSAAAYLLLRRFLTTQSCV